ncbi:MAG: spermidine synthase [Gemmatimonadaceae bacterium]
MLRLLLVAFTLSGAAGLIYESIWSRYLGLFVGHSAYAQIIVLVIFLGGMSLGAALVGRRSESLRAPLKWYAFAELAAGAIGLVFHDAYGAVTAAAYNAIFPALAGGAAVVIVKWLVAALLILPQSILLGTTFPLMSAGALRLTAGRAASTEPVGAGPGRILALLYFTNSIGAAAGVLVGGFYLIALAGLPGTLLAAAMVNIAVGLVVLLASRQVEAALVDPQPSADGPRPSAVVERVEGPGPSAEHREAAPLWRPLLLVAFGTAVASFVYEIAWIRMLSMVLGSATHSFELMLSSFILGLALGAYWVRLRADRFADPVRALGIVQWCMGALAVATLPVYLASFRWMATLIAAFAKTDQGYAGFTILRYAICLAVMLPATFCAGMTLPLITRVLLGAGERAIGAVYSVNTLGSILGAALAGLVLMPLIGLKPLLIVGASVDMLLGVYLLAVVGPRLRGTRADEEATVRLAGYRVPALGVAVATVVVVAFVALEARFEPWLLSSGVYRRGNLVAPDRYKVVFHEDGRTATVSGRRTASGTRTITTNGKPDASLDTSWLLPPGPDSLRKPMGGDQPTQLILPLATLAHAPRARTGAVIGQGSGMSSHILLGSPYLERLVTIDIEPEMIRGSRQLFFPANRRVFEDPRSTFAIDDAKSYFASRRQRFDLILSEPSNPWVSGVSGLFTTEFYRRVRTYLTDDGVFGQWLHLYELDDGLVLSVIAALHENFPSYEVFRAGSADVLIVASNRPRLPAPDWSVIEYPGIAEDLRHTLPLSAEALEALRLAGREALAPLVEGERGGNSDFYPTLDLQAERRRYLGSRAEGFQLLAAQRFDLASALTDRRRGFGHDVRASIPEIDRQAQLALGARLRLAADGTPADSLPWTSDLPEALFRRSTLDRMTAGNVPPADWERFVHLVLDAEADLHGGTAGAVDESFYAPVLAYMTRAKAPAPAVAAVRFRHGLAAFDWREASAAADLLVAETKARRDWVPPDDLRDGGVVAKLRLGDLDGARRVWEELIPFAKRGISDVRTRLLAAHLSAALRARANGRSKGAFGGQAVPGGEP